MYPHRIRLRGPWDCEAAESLAELPPHAGRLRMPCRWDEAGWGGFTGRVRCVRRFGYPGRIDAHERVWLTCAGVDKDAEFMLNGELLGSASGAGPVEFEITNLLRPRNELIVNILSPEPRGGLFGEVALEIRCAAFLRGVSATAEAGGRIRVEGVVAGGSERPLDLYALHRNATIAYTQVQAGAPFRLVSELPSHPADGDTVRVELVDGALRWYAIEVPCRQIDRT